MGQQAPGAAATQQIKDPIEDLAHIYTSGPTSCFGWGNQRFKDGPFGIRKIACIRFHRGYFLLTFYLFFMYVLLLYHISSATLSRSNWLSRPSRTASSGAFAKCVALSP